MGINNLELILCNWWVDVVQWDTEQFQSQEVKNHRRCFRLHLGGKKHFLFIIGPLEKKNLATRQFKPAELKVKDKRISYLETHIKNCFSNTSNSDLTHYLTLCTATSLKAKRLYIISKCQIHTKCFREPLKNLTKQGLCYKSAFGIAFILVKSSSPKQIFKKINPSFIRAKFCMIHSD